MTPREREPWTGTMTPRASRQGFLRDRLASSPGVWLRDLRRGAQARGVFVSALSLSAAGLFLLSGLVWLLSGLWWHPRPGSGSPVLIMSVSWFGFGCALWYLHLKAYGPRQWKRRRRG